MTPTVAAYAISKDEAKHAARWAETTEGADLRVVLDTGSTDDTVQILRDHGVTVIQGGFSGDPGLSFAYGGDALVMPGDFRFDVARNAALDLVPDDIDFCLSLDLDELVRDDFFDVIRETAAHNPQATKLRPWFFTGGWWRSDRVHSRHGWQWKYPCHEITTWVGDGMELHVDVETTMWHEPDNLKPRDYLPLLDLCVQEHPDEARGWTYLTRQHHYAGHHGDVLRCATKMLACPDGPPHERAATCRLAAQASQAQGDDVDTQRAWWVRGTAEAPHEAEAWGGLCSHHYAHQEWRALLEAAQAGLACPQASHYIADQPLRSWGLSDYAAIASHNLYLANT